jgi:methionyl-tRNA synthetase
MSNFKRTLVTAALPYANGPVHLGHLAGCYLPADIYVRYLKLKGEEVLFICGSDEHGVPITLKAKAEGKTPQQVVDYYHNMMKGAFEKFGIDFTHYSRTSSPVHYQTASEFFTILNKKGSFEQIESEQYYDEEAKQFLADRYIVGTCPNCGNENAYGDQCESCGKSLSPDDLINPRSKLSGAKPIKKPTTHWFLKLDEIQDKFLNEYVGSHQDDWKSNVYGQVKSWLDQGMQPRAVTRDLDWGVPVPVEGAEGKVLYVWFDAPIGYISATKEWAIKEGKDWELWWKNNDTRLLHFIGKDNIVFHTLIFPAMLWADGTYILPDNVPANEFLNLEGGKLSTSRNWAVWLHEYMEDLPNREDELRYVLTSIMPESSDSEFTWKDYQARVNNELVAILANFINRVMVLTHKYYEGVMPDAKTTAEFTDQGLLDRTNKAYDEVDRYLANFRFREGLAEVIDLCRAGNKYLTDKEPWKAHATNPEGTVEVLYNCIKLTAHLGTLLQPFLPNMAKRIFGLLNLAKSEYRFDEAIELATGHKLNPAEPLIRKVEDKDVETQIEKLNANKVVNTPAPAIASEVPKPEGKAPITYDDFAKLDIRAGKVVSAEKVEGADKLLKLGVDIGSEVRIVVSGIALYYTPEQALGKQVTILINLQPRKLRGIMSEGMILMAEAEGGKLLFVSPEGDAPAGSMVS